MPTGYTARVIEGKITTFEGFAKLCARAFGATIHMRDENLDVPYESRVPSDYYEEIIKEDEEKLERLKSSTDDEIKLDILKCYNESLLYHKSKLEEIEKHASILIPMLEKANSYVPPTEEHTGIKDFMIDQLKQTLDRDCDAEYHVERIKEIEEATSLGIDVKERRKEMLKECEEDLKRHRVNLKEEEERCLQSNLWVEQYYQSIKGL